MSKTNEIEHLKEIIRPYRERLLCHEIYNNLGSIDYLRNFLENQSFVVWNFIGLIKVLQHHLTCLEVPWVPSEYPNLRRSINQIVLEEESGIALHGTSLSHLEFFVRGMSKMGAKTDQIDLLLALIKKGDTIEECLEQLCISPALKSYLSFTFTIIRTKELHKIAGNLAFGNVHLLPDFFHELYDNPNLPKESISTLQFYFRRKQQLEKNEYKIRSYQLVNELCGEDKEKWKDVRKVAVNALKHRIILWDAMLDQCTRKKIFSFKG